MRRRSIATAALISCAWCVPVLANPLAITSSLTHQTAVTAIGGVNGALLATGATAAASASQALGGTVSAGLAGAHVTSDGMVAAALNSTAADGTRTLAIDYTGDGLLSFAVTGSADDIAADAGGQVSGTAQGGTVLLKKDAAKHILDNVINTRGIVTATSVQKIDGKIVLSARDAAASGKLDASANGSAMGAGDISDRNVPTGTLNASSAGSAGGTIGVSARSAATGKPGASAEGAASGKIASSGKGAVDF